MSFPKIVYPSQPSSPITPVLSQVAGGALAGRAYFVQTTYLTADGESLPGPEATLAIDANKLLKVISPPVPTLPTIATGWNVYVWTVTGGELKQNAASIDIGTDWTEPLGGLVGGGQTPPATWGATLIFLRPPRQVPGKVQTAVRTETITSIGVREIMLQRIDEFLTFTMEFVSGGADAAAWDAFMASALQGNAFDYYPDASVDVFDTWTLELTSTDYSYTRAYRSVGEYTFDVTFRKFVSDGTPVIPMLGPSALDVALAPTTPGNFRVAHGLGRKPLAASILMTSGGSIWFQPSPMMDATYLYLVASAAGITAVAQLW